MPNIGRDSQSQTLCVIDLAFTHRKMFAFVLTPLTPAVVHTHLFLDTFSLQTLQPVVTDCV